MPTCARCGFLVRGPRERCEKCGAPVAGASPRARPELEAAVRAAAAEPAPSPAKPSWRRWLAMAVALAILLGGGLHAAAVISGRNSIPFATGTRWTFAVEGLPGATLTLTVGADADAGRMVRAELVEKGEPVPLGVAYAKRGWRGAYVLGVQRAGTPDPELESVRLLPFPYGPGDEWTEKVGGPWGPARFRLRFQTDPRETVSVPAGRYEALPVRFELAPPVGPVLLKGSYHVAPGVGPVKITLDAPTEFRGLRTLDLRLAEFEGG